MTTTTTKRHHSSSPLTWLSVTVGTVLLFQLCSTIYTSHLFQTNNHHNLHQEHLKQEFAPLPSEIPDVPLPPLPEDAIADAHHHAAKLAARRDADRTAPDPNSPDASEEEMHVEEKDEEKLEEKVKAKDESVAVAADQPSSSTPDYYMVFSTSCSDQQHWESMVFFYHAYKVRQPGNVTRILSGCSHKEEEDATEFFERYIRPMSNRFHLHHTPNYGHHPETKSSFKYMNKPYGVRHWMEHALGLLERDEQVG